MGTAAYQLGNTSSRTITEVKLCVDAYLAIGQCRLGVHGTFGLINPWHHLRKMSSWIGNPGRPPYVIPRGSAGLKKNIQIIKSYKKMQKPKKPEKPILPIRKTRPGGFFGLSVHRAGLDQPWRSGLSTWKYQFSYDH